jgi:uncharacterized protein YkwD
VNTGLRLLLAATLALTVAIPAVNSVSATPTGYDIAPQFQSFYDRYGGVRTFGYAITPPKTENGRLVQYTERQRLEYHPEHRGTEYEVLLGLLGRETARAEGRSFAPGNAISGARYFPQTQQYMEPRFQSYWDSRGGVRIFGYPVTAPIWENGILIQYTERARFEYHPRNAGSSYEVLLGRLGRDLLGTSGGDAVPLSATTNDPADDLIEMLNDERVRAGAPRLVRTAQLNAIAIERSNDMARRSYFSHTTPEGRTVFDIMRSNGLSWVRAGETLHRNNAAQQNTQEAAERARRGFMNSDDHRRILTNGRYQQVGVGYAYGSDGRHYFTVIVMTP